MALLNELTLTLIFTRILAFLIVVGVHGFALAGLLRLMGDLTPRYTGRLTLSPAPHTHMLALVMAILFEMFWINPIKTQPENLRWGCWSLVLAALGALLVTLALVPILLSLHQLVVVSLPRNLALTTITALQQIEDIAIWFVALNWLPLPLLTGAMFAFAVWPKLQRIYTRYQSLTMGLLLAALVTGLLDPAIRPLHDWLTGWLIT
ncbi:hypothetical protein [Devosia naphthalenivorans]|uniref:hypothetical protein n=1 Tax=Devosia naphthalenivorans TaxID=2082392 RepID=UPI000D3790BB|nr:hypothetical protein [Devosia naphthalenivorans]